MGDDSDDDTRLQVQQKITKTAAKKDARKIAAPKKAEETADAFFAATRSSAAAEGDFDQVQAGRQARPATRGGAEARGGRGERGGRGRGGAGRGGAGGRPRTAARTDGDGNPVGGERRERKPFAGKAREEAHPFDRRDGTGKARRGDKKDGHGKGNWGKDGVYKKKEEEGTAEKPAEQEAPAEEEKKEAEPEYVEEILGVSLDDFLGGKQQVGPKAGRAAEKLSQKVEAAGDKQKQSTVQQNAYMKTIHAKTTTENSVLLGVQADDDDVRGGDRRGDRAGNAAQRGGRKQNAKQALKKTEDDFPTL